MSRFDLALSQHANFTYFFVAPLSPLILTFHWMIRSIWTFSYDSSQITLRSIWQYFFLTITFWFQYKFLCLADILVYTFIPFYLKYSPYGKKHAIINEILAVETILFVILLYNFRRNGYFCLIVELLTSQWFTNEIHSFVGPIFIDALWTTLSSSK